MRLVAAVEYNGRDFRGWQTQEQVPTLQTTLEIALSKVANEPISVICAGRTDAGVHATHQIVHFDTQAIRAERAWLMGTNSYLPATLNLSWLQTTELNFHARFDALSRHYCYIIYNHSQRSSLIDGLTTWIRHDLDADKMHNAAQSLLGEQDFSSFRSAQCQSRTAKRHIFALSVRRYQRLVIVDIVANSFLHHMVRNIVGVLLEIGQGNQSVTWCNEVLHCYDRRQAARTAPASGLYLSGVRYADSYALPSYFKAPFFLDRLIGSTAYE